jgi:hypothetical protein
MSLETGYIVTNDDVVHRFMNMERKGRRFDP